jgi:hypothetical protein
MVKKEYLLCSSTTSIVSKSNGLTNTQMEDELKDHYSKNCYVLQQVKGLNTEENLMSLIKCNKEDRIHLETLKSVMEIKDPHIQMNFKPVTLLLSYLNRYSHYIYNDYIYIYNNT